ncbi:POK9 protein, partial [Dromaius novaehollandiae]|nr:POK9 protein [Dromaius novaehollandiae]
SGSAGMDLATATTVTLSTPAVTLVPTGIRGPLGDGLSALLLSRSSATRQGLFVLPGVIDADFTREIQIMVWTPTPPCQIPLGSRIAQLIPFHSQVPHHLEKTRGDGGFGSTGPAQLLWSQKVSARRPCYRCTFKHSTLQQEIQLEGIMDTGADVTIIS